MTHEDLNPYERQPYDTPAAWAYFQLYLEQDPPRSINEAYRVWLARKGRKLARKIGAPGSWRNLSTGKAPSGNPLPGALTWAERAAAWDDHLAALERNKWVERRLALKEKEWDIGEKLLEKAEQMLMFPMAITASEDGQTVIMPTKWTMRDIPAVAQAASKIARLAADMATENLSVDWREEARKAGVTDPDAIYRKLVEQFRAILAGEDDAGSLEGGPTDPGESRQ
jgi:hypothetical protein